MSIDDQGFLSDEIVEYREQVRQQYVQHFDFIYRVNAFCQQAKFRIEIDNQDGQKVIALCFLIKLLNDV